MVFLSPISLSRRVTILFFGICGLDILNSIDAIPSYEREQIIEWIYAQQILPNKSGILATCTWYTSYMYMGCCVALLCCLFDLCFFLPSFFISHYHDIACANVHVCTCVY